jgi:hypothetical protein
VRDLGVVDPGTSGPASSAACRAHTRPPSGPASSATSSTSGERWRLPCSLFQRASSVVTEPYVPSRVAELPPSSACCWRPALVLLEAAKPLSARRRRRGGGEAPVRAVAEELALLLPVAGHTWICAWRRRVTPSLPPLLPYGEMTGCGGCLRGERRCNFASPLSSEGRMPRRMPRPLEAFWITHSSQREAKLHLPPAIGLSLILLSRPLGASACLSLCHADVFSLSPSPHSLLQPHIHLFNV